MDVVLAHVAPVLERDADGAVNSCEELLLMIQRFVERERRGMVASPTPTVPMASDSTR
jgi:hypothetical protein